MKIALLNIKSKRKECINKDFMGGYGWAFNAGTSLPARMINIIKRSGEHLPIISFGYMAAIFKAHNHQVTFQTNVIPEADMVFIASSMVDYKYEIDWARRIKQAGIRVGFIGPFAGYNPDLFLDNCDFVIKGEPEQAAIDISGGMIPKGVVQSAPVQDLDSLPFPSWDIFPVNSYSYFPALKERPFLPVLASRGCLYRCNYCPYIVAYKYRCRSLDSVFSEVVYLKEKFKIRGMIFRDPLFGADNDFVRGLCELMLSGNIRLKWVCETRLNLLNKEILALMYKAGLRVLNTGIESSDQAILSKATRLPVGLQHQEEIIRYCDKLGIRVTAFYILGLPDDTVESIKKTIRYAQHLNTHVAQFFIHTPFPGTEYFEKAKDDIVEKDWERLDCYTPVLKHNHLTKKELLMLKDRAFVNYYYRPSYLKKFLYRAARDILN